jgi:hypothetical protein
MALFRRSLGLRAHPWRLGAALAGLATIPLGTEIAGAAELAALTVLLGAAFVIEARSHSTLT